MKNISFPWFSSKWNIPWQEFDIILNLKNLSSTRNLNINTREQAENFLRSCGLDIQENAQVREFETFLGEALYFIRHSLFKSDELELFPVPKQILKLDDPAELIIYASEKSPRLRYMRLWACALLKVVYIIANIEFSGKFYEVDLARQQIFMKIQELLSKDQKFLFNPDSPENKIPLFKVEWKEYKTRTSTIMKLLHKPDSIVDDVFDYLGVRFIVKDGKEIPQILKILIEKYVIIPHQVISVRTHNTLVDIEKAKKLMHFSRELLSSGTISKDEFETLCNNINWSYKTKKSIHLRSNRKNIFSSEHYKSLQFTVRHLLRMPNISYTILESFNKQLKKHRISTRYEPWTSSFIKPTYTRYFPIEIQILDKSSYNIAKIGPASHKKYKEQQLEDVRNRVLGGIFSFSEEKLKTQVF